MLLGIEIGGTKLQLGVGRGDGRLLELVRREVVPAEGAAGILRQIEDAALPLIGRHAVTAVGCGFGGPVDPQRGRAIKSHQVGGWENYPLADWLRQHLGVPALLGNDCDVACLAEARLGAGRGKRIVFYVTVGTGIGGGLVIDGQIHQGSGSAAAEIGHLRPGVEARDAQQTVESLASGWGIASAMRKLLAASDMASRDAEDLCRRCDGRLDQLTARHVAQAAGENNALAIEVLRRATQTLGWAIAQSITLIAPEVVVIGGGVSLVDRRLFLDPLREQVSQYVFPPLASSYGIEPAELGEEVVVHGALALVAQERG